MSGTQILFLIIALVTWASAVLVVSTRKLLHAALWLVLTLLGVAILFAMLDAAFFAVVQVLVYVGAIAILIIFAVMLTRRIMEDTGPQVNKGWAWAAAGAVGLFAGVVLALSTYQDFWTTPGELPAAAVDLAAFGQALVSPQGYVIPFEVASILLLAALVGALVVAVERKGGRS